MGVDLGRVGGWVGAVWGLSWPWGWGRVGGTRWFTWIALGFELGWAGVELGKDAS